jgi:peptidoglycan/LPS O-acetylase OafA/YrhL
LAEASTHERFLALDGLRGIAALVVFTAHLRIVPAGWPMPQSGLAVEFFFLLSGFVLAHAYEARLGRPGAFWRFVRDRVIRLHPLLVLSLVPVAVLIALTPSLHRNPLMPLTFIASAIPFPALWMHPFPVLSFPYNTPAWSLFWELVVNLLFALAAPRLSTRMLTAVTGTLIAARLAMIASGADAGAFDITAAFRAFPYFALGMLLHRLYRQGYPAALRWAGVLAAPVLIVMLLLPPLPFGSLLPLVVFPFVVAGGAVRDTRFPRLCAFLGGMSYPLYVLHAPIFIALHALFGPPAGAMAAVEPLACLLIVWLAWRLYDIPVRTWLRRRFGSRGHAGAPVE